MSMPSKWLPSMETIQDNIVFAHMTRHSRWPSLRTTVWLFIAAVLVGIGSAVALLVVGPTLPPAIAEPLDYVFTSIWLVVALLSPPVAALVTTITTVTDVQSEAYRLVRVSLLPREEIVSGHIYAALYRLRLLWVLVLGLFLLSTTVDVAFLTLPYQGYPVATSVLDLVAWFLGVVTGIAVNWLAVCFGVWQALRWKYVGRAVGAFVVMFVLGYPALVLVYRSMFNYVVNTTSVASLICFLVSFFFSVSISVYGLTKVIREKAKDCI